MPVDKDGIYHSAVKLVPRIDSAIPVPTDRPSRNDKGYVAVLRILEVGQSVFLPTSRASVHSRIATVRQERLGTGEPQPVFVYRPETSAEGHKGFRVWRSA